MRTLSIPLRSLAPARSAQARGTRREFDPAAWLSPAAALLLLCAALFPPGLVWAKT